MNFLNFFQNKNTLTEGLDKYKSDKNGILLDVRTKEEYADGHIPNSINIPLSNIEQIDYSTDKNLYVYCHSGARSSQACSILKDMGYNAINIGGICLYQGEIER